ncbi:MAG: hypothetical protein QXK89_06025 [Candidatus Bathyarchaeia archaeon]
MPFVEMLTINEERKDTEEILEIIWRALEYFPRGLWEGINYLGNVDMKHDLKVKSKDAIYGAFIFNNLINKIRRVRELLQIRDLLLAVTRDPIIAVYHKFEAERLSRIANLIHDYVSNDVGVISLFRAEEHETASKVVAHGLGHNRGLRHHTKPVDIMYEGLLEYSTLKNERFCTDCIRKILSEEPGS